jgi:hypothetical protein
MPIVVTKSGRMISSLPSLSIAIWLVMACSLLILSSLLAWSGASTRYPGFSILIYFTTLTCLVLLAIAWFASRRTYFWSYYASLIVWDVLTARVAWEVYRKVFGPAIALPTSTPPSARRRCRPGESALLEVLQTLHTLDRQTDFLETPTSGPSSLPAVPPCLDHQLVTVLSYSDANTI